MSKHQGGPFHYKPKTRGQRAYVDLDPADSLLLRQIHEQATITIRKLHNLSVEVSELRAETKTLRSVVLALLADPQAQHELEAIARDLRIQTYKKTP